MKKEKIGLFGIFYLLFLPLVIFSGQPLFLLIISFFLGYLLFLLFQKPSLKKLLIFVVVLGITIIIVKPRLGLDMGQINNINAQRGEHPQYQSSLIPRVIHNKTELVHSFISNFDSLLSPVAIFASGYWHKISRYYPLGFLFPWDLYFIYRYFRYKKNIYDVKQWLLFIPAVLILFLLTGLIYIDQALVYSFAVIYFLALLSAVGYETASKRTRITFIIINTVYLLYQLRITSYFKI